MYNYIHFARIAICVPVLQVDFDQQGLIFIGMKQILEDVSIVILIHEVSVMIRTEKVITTSLDR